MPARAESWQVTTGVSVRGIESDNVRLASPGNEESGFILQTTPSVSVRRNAGRIKLNGDLQLQSYNYAGVDASSRIAPTLSAQGSAELVDNLFFMDMSAQVRQQNTSALRQSVDNALPSGDQAELRTFRLSPYLRGRFANNVAWMLRYDASRTSSSASTNLATNTTQNDFSGNLSGGTGIVGLSWSLNASDRNSNYDAARSNTNGSTYRGSLQYVFNPQWSVTARAGHERNTVLASGASGPTEGVGVQWNPSPRTSLGADYDHRSFGNSYAYHASYRTARTGLSVSLTRNITNLSDEILSIQPGSASDVFFSLYNGFFGSVQDLNQRALDVFNFMQSIGLIQNGQAFSLADPLNFLTSRTFLERRLQVTFSYVGARNSLIVSGFKSQRQDVSSGFLTVDNLSSGLGLDSSTLSVNLGHQLTPITSTNLTMTTSKGASVIGGSASSTQHRYDLSLNTRLGPKTSGNVALRHVTLNGSSRYTENALTATLGITF